MSGLEINVVIRMFVFDIKGKLYYKFLLRNEFKGYKLVLVN